MKNKLGMGPEQACGRETRNNIIISRGLRGCINYATVTLSRLDIMLFVLAKMAELAELLHA